MTEQELKKNIGRKLRNALEEKGITAEQLAYENDISKSYISEILNGKKFPSLPMLLRIAQALEVPLRAFF